MNGLTAENAGRPRAAWGRTVRGWALNLDGSAPSRFALPRLEIEESSAGWICRCRMGDGSAREVVNHAESITAAQRAAVELARGRVAAEFVQELDALLDAAR